MNVSIFEPSWREYDEKFLNETIKSDTNIIKFPILDKSTDIILKIKYIDMTKLMIEYPVSTTLKPSQAINSINYQATPSSFMNATITQTDCRNILHQATLQANTEQICLHYSLQRLLKLFSIDGNYKDFFYETILFQVYSELNKNQYFLSKLISFSKQPTIKISKSSIPTNVTLHFRKYNIYETDKSWVVLSNELKRQYFNSSLIHASPRFLHYCLPSQSNIYAQVLNDCILFRNHLYKLNTSVPPLILKILSTVNDPVQIFSFHYISNIKVILPLAIHPNKPMTFLYSDFQY